MSTEEAIFVRLPEHIARLNEAMKPLVEANRRMAVAARRVARSYVEQLAPRPVDVFAPVIGWSRHTVGQREAIRDRARGAG